MIYTFFTISQTDIATTTGYATAFMSDIMPLLMPVIGLLIGILIFWAVVKVFK